jgi:Restriction Enzyme Adenine Methylase Associated
MAIDGAQRNKGLTPGTRLVAKYKGAEHVVEVIAADNGKVGFRLADGQEFTSPSAAGSAVMGGQACNGWRFWTVQGDEPAAESTTGDGAVASAEHDTSTAKGYPRCERCGKQFVGAAQLAHHEANADRLCVPA